MSTHKYTVAERVAEVQLVIMILTARMCIAVWWHCARLEMVCEQLKFVFSSIQSFRVRSAVTKSVKYKSAKRREHTHTHMAPEPLYRIIIILFVYADKILSLPLCGFYLYLAGAGLFVRRDSFLPVVHVRGGRVCV